MKNDNLSSPPRQRTSVAIQGLDISTPDDIVADGKCEELHNFRWKDNAWRPIYPYKLKIAIDQETASDFTIVYHHPAAGDKSYVAFYNDEPNTYASLDFSGDSTTISPIGTFRANAIISHFGNVLLLSEGNTTSYYFFKDGQYTQFNIPEPPSVETIAHRNRPIRPWRWTQGNSTTWRDFSTDGFMYDATVYMRVVWPIADMMSKDPYIPLTPDATYDAANYWHGEIAFFVAFEMVDGTILSPSLISILASENPVYSNATSRVLTSGTYGGDSRLLVIEQTGPASDKVADWEDASLQFVRGTVRYSIPDNIDTSLITNIVCFCTRINSIFNYGTILDSNTATSNVDTAFADNKLPSQPFYLLGSEKLTKGMSSVTFSLTADNLLNIETNRVYEPNNNIHTISSQVSLDYNNRLHRANISTQLFEGYNITNFISPTTEDELREYTIAAALEIDGSLCYASHIDALDTIPAFSRPAPRIISYPDYRAKQFFLQHSGDITSAFDLIAAPANNVAYYIPKPTNTLKYPAISFNADLGDAIKTDTNIISRPNRLQVSAANNLFSQPFENSYSFGSPSNRIIAMQSAAIEMHEMKVGEMPLYVFTDEGIFALVAGSNTLYSSVVAVNYDKIINPNTLAINGAIVYITENGVHLLTSQGTQIISSEIHGTNGMPPLEFLRSCKIIHPKQFNEVILFNEAYSKAYVYNLDNRYWSTRDLNGKKLNTNELFYNNAIYTLDDEKEGTTLNCSIITRPIKLGNVEFKRLETIIPRIATDSSNMRITISGAMAPGNDYQDLRSLIIPSFSNMPLIIRRTPFSAKYFKFALFRDRSNGLFSITHIDFEWYNRFLHRMR